jgi:hypothetical protein
VEFSEDVWLANFFQTSWQKILSMFGSIEMELTTLLIQRWRFLWAKQLVDRTTKLHRNWSIIDRINNLRSYQKLVVLVGKVIVRMCCKLSSNTKNCLLECSIWQLMFSNLKWDVTTRKSSIFYLACLSSEVSEKSRSNLKNRCWKVRLLKMSMFVS